MSSWTTAQIVKFFTAQAPINNFIPGQATVTVLKILNIGYFYFHEAARNIASEHQLEKNGFTITDVDYGNATFERIVYKNGQRCIFQKYDGIWLCPLEYFIKFLSMHQRDHSPDSLQRRYKKK
jgi:hypothetical protein